MKPRTKRASPKRAPELSPEQSAAVRVKGGDACVRAGAGSGKTRVLVERYLHNVVERGLSPERLLAITFTDKAASEMKERLAEAFADRGTREQRASLERATIGTFHAFCLELLREHPIEAGVDPEFRLLGDGESKVLLGRAMDAVFGEKAADELWTDILAEYREPSVRSALLRVYAALRASDRPEDHLSVSDGTEAERTARLDCIELVRRLPDGVTRAKPTATESALVRVKPGLLDLLSAPPGPAIEAYEALGRIELPGERDSAYKDQIKGLRRALNAWSRCLLEVHHAPHKRAAVEVLRRFDALYTSSKRQASTLDFDDLLIIAERLLRGGTPVTDRVRARVRDRYDEVLVDEYQDTNPLQERLLRHLTRPGSLYTVGDDQQAIYGFRHADPEIFRTFASSPEVTCLDLEDNYRTVPEVLEGITAIFKRLGTVDAYRAQRARRASSGTAEAPLSLTVISRGGDGREADADTLRTIEARVAAERIERWVREGLRIHPRGQGPRPVTYGDIAVLARTTTAFQYYELEFMARGIPYHAVRGRGYYDKPEVKDLLSWLRFLVDPSDDVSLAAVLRSPAIGLSDDGLLLLSRDASREVKPDEKLGPLWSAVEAGAGARLSPPDARRLEEFVLLDRRVRARKDGRPVQELLEEYLRATDLEVKYLCTEGGAQKAANVRKFVEIARQAGAGRSSGATDLVRYIEALLERETEEAEARIETQRGDTVLLSSIHAVKGLEFPCVLVVELGARPKTDSDGPVNSSQKHGIGWVAPSAERDGPRTDRIAELNAMERRKRASAEEERLLYVALTRSREYLALSGTYKPTKSAPRNPTWMMRILAAAGRTPGEADGPYELDGTRLEMRTLGEAAAAGRTSQAAPGRHPALARAWSCGEQAGPAAASAAGLGYDERSAEAALRRLERPVKPYEHTLDLTVTALAAACAAEGPGMALDFVSSEPDKGPEAAEAASTGAGEDGTPAGEYGTIYHAVMEWWLSARPTARPRAEDLAHLLAPLTEDEKRALLDEAEDFWRGEWGRRVLAAERAYAELPFLYKTARGLLKGQIDLVFLDRKGGWTVLDYKTNRASTDTEIDELTAAYQTQVGLYALVFGDLTGQPPVASVLYYARPRQARVIGYRPEAYAELRVRLEAAYERLASARPESLDFETGV
ncbi:MAG: ATP-dependent helicase/nuclease subunit A [Candidatus Omnitrophica bacterium]|nr:ATP-dependent helicase/nuclease subunit A [Candidatus Omnitrophota bacterium]